MRRVSLVIFALLLTIAPVMAAKDQVTDDTVYDQVRIHIANDREIGGNPIEVKVKDGAVELTGKVKTERQKVKAEKIAKKVKGVRSVVNNITISPI